MKTLFDYDHYHGDDDDDDSPAMIHKCLDKHSFNDIYIYTYLFVFTYIHSEG